jgi:hypothetical protein
MIYPSLGDEFREGGLGIPFGDGVNETWEVDCPHAAVGFQVLTAVASSRQGALLRADLLAASSLTS